MYIRCLTLSVLKNVCHWNLWEKKNSINFSDLININKNQEIVYSVHGVVYVSIQM